MAPYSNIRIKLEISNKQSSIGKLFFYLILFSLSFAYLAIDLKNPANEWDEGLVVYAASEILSGKLPYRDFWAVYTPGQYYTLALFFKLFGSTLLVERLWDTVVRSITAVIIYIIAAELTSKRWAITAYAISTLWLGYFVFYGYTSFPAFLFSMVSILLLIKTLKFEMGKTDSFMFLSGLAAAVAGLYRQDFLAYTMASELIVFYFYHKSKKTTVDAQDRARAVAPALIQYFAGAAIVIVPAVIYFVSYAPLGEMSYDLVYWPVFVSPQKYVIDYPRPFPGIQHLFKGVYTVQGYLFASVGWVIFYLPPIFYLAALISVLSKICYQKNGTNPRLWGVLLIILWGVMSFNVARIRPDRVHIMQTFIPATVLLSIMVGDLWSGKVVLTFAVRKGVCPTIDRTFLSNSLRLFLITYILIYVLVMPLRLKIAGHSFNPPYHLEGTKRAGVQIPTDLADTVRYIQGHTKKDDRIFVIREACGRISGINNVMLYFLMDRYSPTRYHAFELGFDNSVYLQEQVIADLNSDKTEYIVLYHDACGNETQNNKTRSILEKFVWSNYLTTERFGQYFILKQFEKNETPELAYSQSTGWG